MDDQSSYNTRQYLTQQYSNLGQSHTAPASTELLWKRKHEADAKGPLAYFVLGS